MSYYAEYFYISEILENYNLSSDILKRLVRWRKLTKQEWNLIITKQVIDNSFIYEFIDYLDPELVLKHQKFLNSGAIEFLNHKANETFYNVKF